MEAKEFYKKVLDKYIANKGTVTNNITDRVFLMIQKDKELLKDYEAYVGGQKLGVANGRISKAIKAKFNLQNDEKCQTPESSLIESYMMFKTK